ncbi:amidase [Amphiplicatus metriothermophilus]|uniref:Amidase n=2 Tax=Amphiplicatus metriothermophilus TaxID=1519374 RepID=A0A239PL12_9PROT|nr:amidase [Amphiplicatus metriothermophilus]
MADDMERPRGRAAAGLTRRAALKAGAAMAAALAAAGCGREASRGAPSGPDDLARLDATALARHIREGHLTAREAVEAAAARIARLEDRLGAFAALDVEAALDRLDGADPAAPLYGVPFAMKDLNEYPGLPFRRGSALFRDAIGQTMTAYTARLDAAGLVTLGKSQTPEFGLLPTTEPLAYRPTANPWALGHSAGGSSGGAAALVAARILPVAQASDGGGSIRIPAACCGVFGLKPSRGRFPDQGTGGRAFDLAVKHAVSLSVRDSAFLLALTEREDGPHAPVGFVAPAALAPLKIAVSLKDGAGRRPDPAVAAAVEEAARLLESMGHEIVPVETTPYEFPGGADAFNAVWAHGAAQIRQLAAQLAGAPPERTGVLEPFTLGLAAAFDALGETGLAEAVGLLDRFAAQTVRWLEDYDAWLTPVLGAPPVRLGEVAGDVPFDALVERLGRYAAYTPIHNVAGTPAMSVPFAWTEDGLPVGVQLSARPGADALLLRLAYALEEARPWADKIPPLAA